MTWISFPTPQIVAMTVNGQPGYLVMPEGRDEDAITFESWDDLKAWVESLAGQIVTVEDPAKEIPHYDDWLEEH